MNRKPLATLARGVAAFALSLAGLALATGGASANTVEPAPSGDCIVVPAACQTVPMVIDRSDVVGMRAFSVTFTLSPELVLCSGLSSITEGTYLSSFGQPTNFQVLDNGSGSYTADGTILGSTCGQTDDLGTLFNVEVKAAVGDATGTITVTSVLLRDCSNQPITPTIGAIGTVVIDTTPPGVVTGLAASQVKSGNGTDGTTGITVTLTPPGDTDLAGVEVYRAPYGVAGDAVGAYPEYDDEVGAGAPAIPSYPPAAPWTLTGLSGTGGVDEPTDRGYWYYVAFATDECGHVSAVSSVTSGTLNYHLGDVSDGSTPGQGDNSVGIEDISLLGDKYGENVASAPADTANYLDVGPTADLSVDALPNTDNVINFEDLVVFAINYGPPISAPRMAPAPAGEVALYEPAIALELAQEGDLTVARLSLVDNPNHVKGIHAFVSLDGLEIVSAERGSLAASQAGPVFFETLEENGGVWVDLALLGRGLAFDGSGEIAVLTLAGDGNARLGDVDLRDRKNRPASRRPVDSDPPAPAQSTSVQATGLPSRVELSAARPNPFGNSTEIAFRLPASAEVSLTVHDVTGRLVRTLVDRTVGAGEMSVSWDGRTDGGDLAGAGIYFYTLRTGDHRETRKLLRVN